MTNAYKPYDGLSEHYAHFQDGVRYAREMKGLPVPPVKPQTQLTTYDISAWLLSHYRKAFPEERGYPRNLPNTYAGIIFTQQILAGLGYLHPNEDLTSPQMTSTVHETHWSIVWAANGYPTFQLSHSLVAALLLTDPGNVRADEIEWPLDIFYIKLAEPNCPISFWDNESNTAIEVRGIAVRRTLAPITQEGKQELTDHLMVQCGWNDYTTRQRDFTYPPLEQENSLTEWSVRYMATGGNHRQLWQSAPWPQKGTEARVSEWTERKFLPEQDLKQLDADASTAMRRLLVNFLLYLQALKDNKREVPVKKRHKGTVDFYEVPLLTPETGRTVRLDRELMDAARDWAHSARQPARWKLRSQVVVMGHYRDVPYGPLNVEPRPTRRRWIEPYRRGPEDKDPVAHTYKVGK